MTVNGVLAVNNFGVLGEIVVCSVDVLPTGKAVGAYCGIAVFAGGNYSVGNPAMTRCRNNGTPINDRITAFAEGSSGVTGLGAGCIEIINHLCGMHMPAGLGSPIFRGCSITHCVVLSIHVMLCSREATFGIIGLCQLTVLNGKLKIERPGKLRCPQ